MFSFKLRKKSQYFENKIKYKFYNPFTLGIFDLIKNAFQCLKKTTHYILIIGGNNSVYIRRAAGSSLTGVTALWSLSKTHLS